jgi:hypothetical protein
MPRRRMSRFIAMLCGLLVVFALPCFAQFTASIQGVVQDQSGADVSKASVELVNIATGTSEVATSDASIGL